MEVGSICEVNPEFVPGSVLGHIVSGLFFMALSLIAYWAFMSRYFKSLAPGSRYEFDGRIINLVFPFLPWLSLEAAILFLAGPTFLGVETIHHVIYVDNGDLIQAGIRTLKDVHAFALYPFLPYCIVTLLSNKKSLQIPDNCPQMIFFFGYALFGCVYFGHNMCEYEITLHRFFLITPIILGAACAFGQLRNPSSFLLATAMIFWTFAIGGGLLAIAFIGYYYSDVSPHWKHMPTHDKIKHIPPYFAVHCVLMVTLFVLLFILFGQIRGRRLGRDNPVYMWSRALNSNNNDEYTPLKASDKEIEIYSCN